MKYKLSVLVAVVFVLSACRSNHIENQNLVNNVSGRIKQSETQVYENSGEYYSADLTREPENFDELAETTEEKAERISRRVMEFNNVDRASVIIIGNRAVIGIEVPDNMKDEELIDLKNDIAKAVRSEEESIDHAAVTAGPELIRRINNVADYVTDEKKPYISEEYQELIDELTPAF